MRLEKYNASALKPNKSYKSIELYNGENKNTKTENNAPKIRQMHKTTRHGRFKLENTTPNP